jgi:hypothetical protein
METLQRTRLAFARVEARPTGIKVFVDCADAARQDVLVYWLQRGGYWVHDGPLPESTDAIGDAKGVSVLLTDRFGPGLGDGTTIFQRKTQWPGLRMIVIGNGDQSEPAQLSLARAAGADVTLSARVDREALFQVLSVWA